MLSYFTGNNWATDPDTGESCVGCGPQEQFYGCSDIAITPLNGNSQPPVNDVPITIHLPRETTIPAGAPTITTITPTTTDPHTTTLAPTTTDPHTTTTVSPPGDSAEEDTGVLDCASVGAWAGDEAVRVWCNINCNAGFCPTTHCHCQRQNGIPATGCRPTLLYSKQPGITDWCITNCRSGYCPSTHCMGCN